MKSSLFVCAQSASLDRQSNSLSIFNVLEEINAPSFPVAVPSFTIVSILSRDTSEPDAPGDVRLTMHLDRVKVMDAPFHPKFQGRVAVKIITNIQGMLFLNPGKLTVALIQGESVVAEWPIYARQVGLAQLSFEMGQIYNPPGQATAH